jgi:hypothetical protein
MKSLITSLILFLSAVSGFPEDVLRETSWTTLQAEGRISGGTVEPPGGDERVARLKVENHEGQQVTVTVLTLTQPPITRARYAITGSVRYEGVQGTAFLEMWSVFPDGGRYFSRTLADVGPLKGLQGSSEWRPFVLPFFNREGAPPPTTLIVNVALPGPGTVHLRPLRLVQYGPGEDPLAMHGQWWGERTGGLVGGLLGGALGCLGAVIGWLSSTGRARSFVLVMMKILIGLGVAALLAGALAFFQGQPYAVYYPLLLLGILASVICGGLLRPIRHRYEAVELRRIRAADVR